MSQVRDIGLVAAFLFSYLSGLVAIVVGSVREAHKRGERVSLLRLWIAGTVAAYGTVYVVVASLNTLL